MAAGVQDPAAARAAAVAQAAAPQAVVVVVEAGGSMKTCRHGWTTCASRDTNLPAGSQACVNCVALAQSAPVSTLCHLFVDVCKAVCSVLLWPLGAVVG